MRDDLTPPYFRYTARLIRPFPDFDFPFIKPLRRRAVRLLDLKTGNRVLDAGCGPGGSFPDLVRSVGVSGRVVGVEISPEVAANTKRRIEKNRWSNVEVIEAPAQTAPLVGTFDGLLMFAAPDVYGSEEALANISRHLRPGSRVVLFGAKMSTHRWGRMLNPLLRGLFNLSFPTTPRPSRESWCIVARRVARLDVEEYFLGLMFLAWGKVETTEVP